GLAVVSLVAAYSIFSGFYGLVAIQGLQFICVLVSTIAIVVLAVGAAPPFERLRSMAIEATGNPAWGQLLPGEDFALPAGYAAYEPWLFLATIYLLRNVLFGMGAGDDPKCLAAQRDTDCPKLSLLWVTLIALRWPTMMAFAVLAITVVHADSQSGLNYQAASQAVRMHLPDGDWRTVVASLSAHPSEQPESLRQSLRTTLGEDWHRRLPDLTEQGTLDPERLIPVVLETAVPSGLRGLILVSLLAAATAGLSGWLNQAAGLFANDIYLVWFRPSAGTAEQIATTWSVVLVVVGLGYLLAFSSPTVNDIWSWLQMGLGSGLIVAQLLPLYWRRYNGVGFAAGLAGGLLAATLHRLAMPYLGADTPLLGGEWFLLAVVLLAGLVASIVGTLLSPETDRAVLSHFYLKTLPFGFWSVERSMLPTDQRKELSKCHSRDVTTLPVALLYQVMIFLSPMLAVVGKYSSAALCAAAAAVSLLALWRVYFSQLDEESDLVDRIQMGLASTSDLRS
ncbi:MAG: hypothetical protein AAF266_15230, partial [Planctomycetota bacterium]